MKLKEHTAEKINNHCASMKATMVHTLNLETIQVDNVISMMAKVPSVNVQMARKLHRLIFLHLSSINGKQPSPLTMWCYIIYSDPSYLKSHINGFGNKSAQALRDIKIYYYDHYEILEKGTALRMIQKCTHAINDDLAYVLDPEVRGSLSGHEMRQIEAAFRSGMSLIASAIGRAVMNKPVYLTKRPVGFEPPQTRGEYAKLFKEDETRV